MGFIRGSIGPVPWLLPGLGLSILLGVLVAVPLARALRTRPVVAWALVTSVGLVIASTLTPLRRAGLPGFEHESGCSFARVGIAPLLDMRYEGDAALNILLFIPLGLVLAALPNARPKALLIAAAVAFPFVIEIVQSYAAVLGRGCESDDVIDNVTGLVVGLVVGSAVIWIWNRLGRDPVSAEGTDI